MPYLPFEKELYILKLDFSHSPILQLLFHHNIHVYNMTELSQVNIYQLACL